MSTALLVLAACAAAYIVVSIALGLVIGRSIDQADQRRPRPIATTRLAPLPLRGRWWR